MSAPAPSPAALSASFDVTTGKVGVQMTAAAPATELGLTDIMFNGPQAYSQLVLTGIDAQSKTPGYPNTISTIQMDSWPMSTDATVKSVGTSLPAVQYWDLKDNQGTLKELVYTDASGTSNVLYLNSTANLNHVVTLIPGGSKAVADGASAPAPSTEETTSVTVYIGGCSVLLCCCAIIAAVIIALKQK